MRRSVSPCERYCPLPRGLNRDPPPPRGSPEPFAIHGPVDAESSEIPPAGTDNLKVEMKTGSYEASASGLTVAPFSFNVGPERASGQNDLQLP